MGNFPLQVQVDHARGVAERRQHAELDAVLVVRAGCHLEPLDQGEHGPVVGVGLDRKRNPLERARAGLEKRHRRAEGRDALTKRRPLPHKDFHPALR